ncbi:hypothetical protein USB125703_00215 [Pseudoclavibacter triregionum]|nr:hypothetical protein USB125703_00215 [Pseudoclavibacter triregionum]
MTEFRPDRKDLENEGARSASSSNTDERVPQQYGVPASPMGETGAAASPRLGDRAEWQGHDLEAQAPSPQLQPAYGQGFQMQTPSGSAPAQPTLGYGAPLANAAGPIGGAPGVPTAQQLPAPLRFFSDGAQMLNMGVHFGIMLVGTLVAGILSMLLLSSVIASAVSRAGGTSSSSSGFDVDQIVNTLGGSLLLGVGYLFGGHLDASVTVSSLWATVSVNAAIDLVPHLALLLLGLVIAGWGWFAETRAPLGTWVSRILAALAPGLPAAIVTIVLAATSHQNTSVGGAAVDLSAMTPLVVFGALGFYIFWAFLGRAIAALAARRGRTLNPLRAISRAFSALPWAIREPMLWVAAAMVCFVPVAIVAALIASANADDFGGNLGMIALAAVQWTLSLIALGHFTPVHMEASGFGDTSTSWMWAFSPNASGAWCLPLFAVLATLLAGLWIGASRRRAAFSPLRAGAHPAIAFIAWAAIALPVARASFTATLTSYTAAGGSAVIGLAWWSPVMMLVWAVLVELAAAFLPSLVYGISPGLFKGLVGRGAAEAWFAGPAAPSVSPGASAPSSAAPAAPLAAVPADGSQPHEIIFPEMSAREPREGEGAIAAAGATAWQPEATFGHASPQHTGQAPFAPAHLDATAGYSDAPAVAPGQPTAFTPVPAPAPMDPKRKRKVILALSAIGAALLLIVGGIVVVNVMNGQRSPEAAVRQYVQAIADGDAESANHMVDPNIPSEARGYLTNDMLASATERIEIVSVKEADKGSGDQRAVTVEYRLGGVAYSATVNVERGSKEYGLLDTWRILTPLVGTGHIASNVPGPVTVGSSSVEFTESDKTSTPISTYLPSAAASTSSSSSTSGTTQYAYASTISAYPAIYPVSTPANNYFTYTAVPLTVIDSASRSTGSSGESASGGGVVATATSALQAKVDEAVHAHLDECVKSTSSRPSGCGFSTYTGNDKPVTWTVVSYPTATITSPSSFTLKGGEVRYTYDYTSFTTTKQQTGTVKMDSYSSPSGTISFDGSNVTVTFETS